MAAGDAPDATRRTTSSSVGVSSGARNGLGSRLSQPTSSTSRPAHPGVSAPSPRAAPAATAVSGLMGSDHR